MLLLSGGQTGLAWEPSKKLSFGNRGALDRQVISFNLYTCKGAYVWEVCAFQRTGLLSHRQVFSVPIIIGSKKNHSVPSRSCRDVRIHRWSVCLQRDQSDVWVDMHMNPIRESSWHVTQRSRIDLSPLLEASSRGHRNGIVCNLRAPVRSGMAARKWRVWNY
jgi:hypothetical protein